MYIWHEIIRSCVIMAKKRLICPFEMLHFALNLIPHLNRTSGCRDMNNSLKLKNKIKHKNISPLQLKINIPDIRLIPLGYVTYSQSEDIEKKLNNRHFQSHVS